MASSEVKLLGSWSSPYVMRARIALDLKGIDYEFIQEDTSNKSELLLQSNPVHKKIPVLLHNDKPICESLLILQYIDESWLCSPSILPNDPYERALARFWAAYVDDKLTPSFKGLKKGLDEEEKAAVREEISEHFRALDVAFVKLSKGKPYFGGDEIGYMDMALGCFWVWLKVGEKVSQTNLLDEAKVPAILKWGDRFCSHDAVKDVMPQPEQLMEYYLKKYPTYY